MDYKDKLVELVTKCIEDENMYLKTVDEFRHGHTFKTRPMQLQTHGNIIKSRIRHYNLDKTSHLNQWTEHLEKRFYGFTITFPEHPPVQITFYNTPNGQTYEENIKNGFKKFFYFFKVPKKIIKLIEFYSSKYVISQGSLEADLTIEEAEALFSKFEENERKFAEKRDLEKLNERLNKYNK